MNKYIYHLVNIAFKVLPMDRNMVYFSSFSGLYNDNPRYISQELHRQYPGIKIVWVVDSRANVSDIPDYIRIVQPGTFSQLYLQNRSKVLVDNGAGLMYAFKDKWDIKMRLLKKYKQLDYSTWHGTPLKKIGADIKEDKGKEFYSTTTTFVFNSIYISEIFKKSFSSNIPYHLFGSPRNDLLFCKDELLKIKTKEKLGLPLGKRVVIYAPTYRSSLSNVSGDKYSVYMSYDEVHKCLKALQDRFGDEWVFVYRVHQFVLSVVDENFDNEMIFDGNKYDDMAEYLFVSDVLITDYSGSLFDYTITKNPCFLYTSDFSEYSSSRGLYMSLEELPYPKAKNIEELTNEIQNFDPAVVKHKVELFNKKLGMIDDGHASERIVNLMSNEVGFNK